MQMFTDTGLTIPAIIIRVEERIRGRLANKGNNIAVLSELTNIDGDHLEIGALFGGSAIVVALVKKNYKKKGHVYTIDPLNGYYGQDNDITTKLPVDQKTFDENLKRFGVADQVTLIKAKSLPMPTELWGKTFATMYIDGDHSGETPLNEFCIYEGNIEKYIIFDDFDMPAAKKAYRVACSHKGWEHEFSSRQIAVIRRL